MSAIKRLCIKLNNCVNLCLMLAASNQKFHSTIPLLTCRCNFSPLVSIFEDNILIYFNPYPLYIEIHTFGDLAYLFKSKILKNTLLLARRYY